VTSTAPTSPLHDALQGFLDRAAKWLEENRESILAFIAWGAVQRASDRSALYAPPHRDAWHEIADREPDLTEDDDVAELIISLYSPNGIAHDQLRDDLFNAPILASRRDLVSEVFDSLADRRHYVTVCGALPLVEAVLNEAAGDQFPRHPTKRKFKQRLHDETEFTPEEQARLIANAAAIDMLETEIPKLWTNKPVRLGDRLVDLNRNVALHGAAVGWATEANAVRALLLLAAAVQVAEPLLGPRPAG
jgi:hypothetical protein